MIHVTNRETHTINSASDQINIIFLLAPSVRVRVRDRVRVKQT